MKLTTTQPTISIDPTQPTELPLDPHNPLIWIIVLTALLTAIEKPLNAIANLFRALKPKPRPKK